MSNNVVASPAAFCRAGKLERASVTSSGKVGRSLARLDGKGLAQEVKEFAEHLRSLRQRTGLTSARLEQELGMAAASLSRYLSGDRLPEPAWLRHFQDWVAENTETGLTDEDRTIGRNLLYAASLTKNLAIARELEFEQLDTLWAERINKVEQHIDTVADQLTELRANQATDHESITDLEARLNDLYGLVTLLESDRRNFAEMATHSTPMPAVTTPRHPHVWESVPLRNPDFVGREDLLERLHEQSVEPVVLYGMAGVGKTQTVVEYLHRHATEYDLVWWLHAEDTAQLRAGFAELAEKLGTARDGKAVLDALRTGEPFQRWIIVFDDIDEPDLISKLMPTGPGRVLVTSRNPNWAGVARSIEVDLFSRAESKEFLRSRSGEIEDTDAEALAEVLGDLPLALDQAAMRLVRTGMPVAEYSRLVKEGNKDLLNLSVWNASLDMLLDRSGALEILQLSALLGPEPISRDVLVDDSIRLNDAIQALTRRSLIKVDRRDNTVQVHLLLQSVIRSRMAPDRREVVRINAHLLLAKGDPKDPDNPTTWPRYAALLPHVIASRAAGSRADKVILLIHNLVNYLLNVGSYQHALEISEQAFAALATTRAKAMMELNRARALAGLGRVADAVQANKTVRVLASASPSGDQGAAMIAAEGMRFNLRVEGLLSKERDQAQHIFRWSMQELGEDDAATLRRASSLAECHRLAGEYAKARELDEETVQRTISLCGPDHLLTLRAQCGLAMSIRECGQYEDACRMQKETNARLVRLLGPDHPLTLGGQRSLAVAMRRIGLHTEAWRIVQDCYKRCSRRYGDWHENTATVLMDKAILLRQGDHHHALETGDRALNGFYQIYEPAHPFSLIAATNLAVTWRIIGNAEEAHRTNEDAVEGLRAKVGADHPYTLAATSHLAGDLVALGEHGKAYELDMDTLDRARRTLGDEHPITVAFKHNVKIDRSLLRRNIGEEQPLTDAAGKVRMNIDTDTMQL